MNEADPINARKIMASFLKRLAKGPALLVNNTEKSEIVFADHRRCPMSMPLLAQALSGGLVLQTGDHLTLQPCARSFLRRAASENEEAFLDQHQARGEKPIVINEVVRSVQVNQAESPLFPLLRLKTKSGAPFLPQDAVSAGERLLCDFTHAGLQPRVTASWEPQLANRTRGSRGGMAEMTDGVVGARVRLNRAIDAMGPELAGVALDICCFMKGLEVVERERQWPARSAKLMLRTALMTLARHYNPPSTATSQRMRQWATADNRPDLL